MTLAKVTAKNDPPRIRSGYLVRMTPDGVSMLRLPFRIFNGGSSIIMAGYGAATVDLKLHS